MLYRLSFYYMNIKSALKFSPFCFLNIMVLFLQMPANDFSLLKFSKHFKNE